MYAVIILRELDEDGEVMQTESRKTACRWFHDEVEAIERDMVRRPWGKIGETTIQLAADLSDFSGSRDGIADDEWITIDEKSYDYHDSLILTGYADEARLIVRGDSVTILGVRLDYPVWSITFDSYADAAWEWVQACASMEDYSDMRHDADRIDRKELMRLDGCKAAAKTRFVDFEDNPFGITDTRAAEASSIIATCNAASSDFIEAAMCGRDPLRGRS